MEFNLSNKNNYLFEYINNCKYTADRVLYLIKEVIQIPSYEIKLHLIKNLSICCLFIKEVLSLFEKVIINKEKVENKNLYKFDVILLYLKLERLKEELNTMYNINHQYVKSKKNSIATSKNKVHNYGENENTIFSHEDHYLYMKDYDLREAVIDFLTRDFNLVQITSLCYFGLRCTHFLLMKLKKIIDRLLNIINENKIAKKKYSTLKCEKQESFIKNWDFIKKPSNDSFNIIDIGKHIYLLDNL